MDSMHPDPTPGIPPSLPDLKAQVARLEASHKEKGLPLSGRIIHVMHHLPVEIVRVVPADALEAAGSGVLSPPMTPEFKPEDAETTVESAKWRIHARTAHPALVSGIKSLSDTHDQVLVAWTGEVLIQPDSTASSQAPSNKGTFPSIASSLAAPFSGATEAPPPPPQDAPLMVFGGEFNDTDRKELKSELDRFSQAESGKDKSEKLQYIPVFLPPDVSKGHYEGFCKKTLWPLFHYLLWLDSTATVPSPDPSWLAYEKTNQTFAHAVAEVYRPGDLIICHDYHLLLAPKMIREALGQVFHPNVGWGTAHPSPSHLQANKKFDWDKNEETPLADKSKSEKLGGFLNNVGTALGQHLGALEHFHGQPTEIMIGMFMHTPWPSSEIFRCLPKRKEILDGMLGANLVSFQTYSYSRHFVSTCIRVCGYESTPGGVDANGQVTAVGYCPIGIDIKRVIHDRDQAGVIPKMQALRALYKDKKIIVGREKLDVAKGVYNKLQAFEKFLQVYPEWRNKVVLIQVTTPALSESPKLERMTAELVSQINGTYGSLDFTPVHHYHQALEKDEYFGLLSVADLALITSLRDGMNTTSMEFILCQDKTAKSPLVLSEFMGTAPSFASALQINPHDLLGVAHAINKGLSMGEQEKVERHANLLEGVLGHTSHTWAATILKQLLENVGGEHTAHQTPALDLSKFVDGYKKAKKRLLLFDYDGTLTPIVKVPAHAVPTEQTRDAIATLAEDPKNVVYLISGRDGDFLEEHWGHLKRLGMSAEHGSFVKRPGEDEFINMTESLDMSWMSEVEEIFKYYTERTTGSTIEVKKASITWHYRNSDPDFGDFQCKQCLDLLESSLAPRRPIEVLVGKKNLEVRPLAVNKGEIVRRLMYENPDADLIFCAGDDKTDEDMFRALRTIFPPGGIVDNKVVMKPPVAVTSTLEPEDVAELPDVELSIRPNDVFATAVGPPAKKTLANWHVTCPEEVVEALETILDENVIGISSV
ncbi:trehalose-phosphatase, variant 1 [Cryptococcus amylolentus CBS 6039]|uniref:Trehalose-phosphatase n=1 Tax=Cryptococcus amylolentus CBS 6039 TaxID=1295533 RepID=A0A1E3I7V0_9TREE|nr:trehalose-phosphatase [Cryptococcus amylolentus CBS 6039]XP_018998468.1 trehalose-phosphatase, variant 1 [Cryptococcus amylolentus CBS 6039]ODN84664.1 trehalose-phosphatase [Cryptococcus amylolentus CBS 6039]ODN84665.1 trehalose-phosphatase, variant 1 [Cryptococcus amylolentus CBS 6039]